VGTHQVHQLVQRLPHRPAAEIGEGPFQPVQPQLLVRGVAGFRGAVGVDEEAVAGRQGELAGGEPVEAAGTCWGKNKLPSVTEQASAATYLLETSLSQAISSPRKEAEMSRLESMRSRVPLILLAAMTLMTSAASGQDGISREITPSSQDALRSAASDWQARRWPEAITKYRAILAGSPSGLIAAEAHLKIGAYLAYVAPPPDAMAEYERALAAAPGTRFAQEAKAGIASLQFAIGDYAKARDLFQEVLSEVDDWDLVKYATYRLKELDRKVSRMSAAQSADITQCGVDALREVLRRRGKAVSLEQMAHLIPVEEGMTSLDGLAQGARAVGLQAIGVKMSLEKLAEVSLPAIAHLWPNHYAVVTRIGPSGVELIDPEWGRTEFTKQEFRRQWTGYALAFPEQNRSLDLSVRLSREEMRQVRGGHHLHGNNLGGPGENGPSVFDPGPSSPGPSPSGCSSCLCKGLPKISVNLSNFNLLVQDTEFSYSGRGPGVFLQRTYNADDSEEGAFGRSWTFNYAMTIEEAPNGGVNVKRESGKEDYFAPSGCNRGVCNFNPPIWTHDTLVKNADGTYDLRVKRTRLTYRFDIQGHLNRITDRNGNAVTLQYGPDGKLQTVTDAVGRVTTFFYGANGKISRVLDPGGREAAYSYDTAGNLVGTTDMGGNQILYTYDANSYMTSLTTPRGTWRITNVRYSESAFGLVVSAITDPLGNSNTYSTPGNVVVEVRDGDGKAWTYLPMNNGEVTAATDPVGNTTRYGFSSVGDRTSFTDARGRTASLTYDVRGNVASLSDPLKNRVVLAYDNYDNLTRVTDPLRRVYRYTYDTHDNLIATTDPANATTRFAYDSFGQLTSITDARGNTNRFTYDSRGNLVSSSTPLGKITSFTYDALGRRTSTTTPNGHKISYIYDGIDRLSSITYPDGNVLSYSYGCCSLSSIQDRSGILSFTYDAAGRLTSFKDAAGHVIQYAYDKTGNLIGLTYPDGKVVTYGYDAARRLREVTDWLGNRTAYSYDATGNLLSTSAANGILTIYRYDDAGRFTGLLNFRRDGTVLSQYTYTLNALGQRIAIDAQEPVPPSFQAVSVASRYDADNRLLTVGATAFTYDDNGNLVRDTAGGSTNTYEYDLDDHLIKAVVGNQTSLYEYDPLGNRTGKTINGFTTRYVVNPRGSLSQVLAQTDSDGKITSYYVYGLGLISKITPDGNGYFYQYDGLGNTAALTDSLSRLQNSYGYDAFGILFKGSVETVANPFRYAGFLGVSEEENGLLYMRARYYSPASGRFITPDLSGLNEYAYANNNPILLTDPLGLWSMSMDSITKAVGGAFLVGGVVVLAFYGGLPALVATGEVVGVIGMIYTGLSIGQAVHSLLLEAANSIGEARPFNPCNAVKEILNAPQPPLFGEIPKWIMSNIR
jgi:RHS repeat-associated protein